MDRFSKGIKAWADVQAKHLVTLRKLTAKDVEVKPIVEKRAVLLVEPRCHPALEFAIRNLRWALPSWPIILVHGTENESFIKEILKDIHGDFHLFNCKVDDMPPKVYNTLFMQTEFWKQLPLTPEYILVSQTDVIVMKQGEEMIESIIQDEIRFVGAPWNYVCSVCQGALDCGCGHMIDQKVVASLAPDMVGNGGFSLRHLPSMLAALDRYSLDTTLDEKLLKIWKLEASKNPKQKGTTNEDVFFCKCFKDMNFKIADRKLGLEFAIEQLGPSEWKLQGVLALGAHKPWAYLPDKLVKNILDRMEIK
jgi:hypothetical protein